jgi:hypothetical protein
VAYGNEDDDTIDGEIIVRSQSDTVLGTLSRAETDMQITTAKQYPRSVKRFLSQVRELVTLNEDVAGECMYALPRGGKSIEGPSARFAEVILSCWGNSHGAARVVGEDDKFVTAQAVIWDLERNVRVSFETRRRITNKGGKRYDDDMIGVTGNAAASIAFRNAVLKVVPKAFLNQLYLEARRVAVGDVKTLDSRRAALIQAFAKMGVTEAMVLGLLEKPGVEDIGLDDLALLRGVFTAIRDEGQSIESIFNKPVEGAKVAKSTIAPKAPPAPAPPAPAPPAKKTKAVPPPPAPEPEAADEEYDPGIDAGEESQEVAEDEGNQEEPSIYQLLWEEAEGESVAAPSVRRRIDEARREGGITDGEAMELEVKLQQRIDRVKSRGSNKPTTHGADAVSRGKARKQNRLLGDEPGDGREAYQQ